MLRDVWFLVVLLGIPSKALRKAHKAHTAHTVEDCRPLIVFRRRRIEADAAAVAITS